MLQVECYKCEMIDFYDKSCKMSCQDIVTSCFASFWIMGGLLFLTVGFVVIGSGGMPIWIALIWTSMSMIPLIIGCCICYCTNKDKCNRAFTGSTKLRIVSIGTMSDQQPSTYTNMSPQVQMRVIFLFHNLNCEVIMKGILMKY